MASITSGSLVLQLSPGSEAVIQTSDGPIRVQCYRRRSQGLAFRITAPRTCSITRREPPAEDN